MSYAYILNSVLLIKENENKTKKKYFFFSKTSKFVYSKIMIENALVGLQLQFEFDFLYKV